MNISSLDPLRFLKRLIPRRTDALGREQGQAMVRVGVSSGVVLYLVASHWPLPDLDSLPAWLVFSTSFLALSILLTILAYRDRKSSLARRTITNIADISAITYLMWSTEEIGVPLAVLYLWVNLGNGFRFGVRAMWVSTLLSLAGFGVVYYFSPIWRLHPSFGLGVFGSLVLLPLYSSHLIHQLTLARRKAEEASAAKSLFLARMSHELRTPLNGVLGTTELLAASKRLTHEDRSLLNVIKDSVNVSLRQINNVLDFSKIEAGKLILEQTEFDLHELVNGTVQMVRAAATEKRLPLLVRIDPGAPYRLVGDPHHLREILLNLLSNAIKFTERGYVCLEITSKSGSPTLFRFEVRDTGIGIAAEAIPRIFQSFTQEDTTTTRRYGGTGLGTTIAMQLAEAMGGRIGVESVKDQGSVFWVEIPLRAIPGVVEAEDLGRSRLIYVTKDARRPREVGRLLGPSSPAVLDVPSCEEAIAAMVRTIRLGNPPLAVLVDGSEAGPPGPRTPGADLWVRSSAAGVPLILLTDENLGLDWVRQSGFAAVLPFHPSPDLLRTALRASPHRRPADDGVIRIEPWAWHTGERPKRRVLVADDNKTNLVIVRKMLERANYDVDVAHDGYEAIEKIEANRYKAAILDMHMPGRDGTEIARYYRTTRPHSRMPIVILTANATLEAQSASADAGADAYLTKPVTSAALLTTLEQLIDDYEVTDLARHRTAREAANAPEPLRPILDLTILAELDRVCALPSAFQALIDQFERDGLALLDKLRDAVATRNHSGFADWTHALKGSAANMGAAQLADRCREAEALGLIDFHREGRHRLARIEEAFTAALAALRDPALRLGDEARADADSA